MDPLSLILGGGQLLGGLVSGLFGSSQKRQGKHLLANSPHLGYEIPPEAIQASAEGLPSEQYAQAMKNIQAQQAQALSAAGDRKSGLAAIAKTQAITDNAVGDLDARNAAARMQNQQRLVGFRDKAWDVKNRQREEDRAYAYGLMGAGNTNISSGIDKGIAGLGYAGYGLFGGDGMGGMSSGGGGSDYGSYSPSYSDYKNRKHY
jgi:hypothetical protein